jgi:hypothetical protein
MQENSPLEQTTVYVFRTDLYVLTVCSVHLYLSVLAKLAL